MSKHKVEITGIKTGELKVLTNEEQKELFNKFKNGDLCAREQIIESNYRLVLSILRKFTNRCENMDDLFQVGCIGLCKAVDNFDLSYNVRFSTYAVPMIIGEVRRYLRDGREASIDEISEIINESPLDIISSLEATKEP